MKIFAAPILALLTCLFACGSSGERAGTGGAGGAGGAGGGASTGGHAGGAAASGGGGAGATGGSGGSGGGQAGGGGSSATSAGTIVPLYTDPSDASWSALATAATAHPTVHVIAIANPNSGPGAQKQSGYTTGIAKLKAAHVLVIGYVATGYAIHRTAAEVRADIDTWANFYPAIGGIFFDEMSSTAGDESFYSTLKDYAGMHGFPVTVGNPGTDTLASFVGTVDTILIYESGGLPPVASLGGWHDGYARSNFGVIPYAVGSLDSAFVMSARQHVGFVYMTDDDLPNPWDSLTSYFDPLLASLE